MDAHPNPQCSKTMVSSAETVISMNSYVQILGIWKAMQIREKKKEKRKEEQ